MIKLAVFGSAETTYIKNNFRNEISAVDRKVDGLSTKLEQDGVLGNFMISIGSCDCKAEQNVDDASIGTSPT